MSTEPTRVPAPEEAPTANDRWKRQYGLIVPLGILASVLLHVAVFTLVPSFQAADIDLTPEELAAIELPPEVRIPPPPEAIQRPATPRVSADVLDEDITIAATTFEDNPASELAPPPPEVGVDPSEQPVYIARDIEPRLLNGPELVSLMQRMYPRALREAGIGGDVLMWVYVDEQGNPANAQINRSSGHSQLDDTALAIAQRMRFSPAMLRDQPVAVWIAQPITFNPS